jgi:hypothetical protein
VTLKFQHLCFIVHQQLRTPLSFLVPIFVRAHVRAERVPSSAKASTTVMRHPREEHLTRGKPFVGDVRTLPQVPPTLKSLRSRRCLTREPRRKAALQLRPQRQVSPPPLPRRAAVFEGLDFAKTGAPVILPIPMATSGRNTTFRRHPDGHAWRRRLYCFTNDRMAGAFRR